MTTPPHMQVYWGDAAGVDQCPCVHRCIRPPVGACTFPATDNPPSCCDDGRPKEPLRVRKIDPCIAENAIEHHTGCYDLMKITDDPQLVVRRGQHFFLLIILERNYSSVDDGVSFVLQLEGMKTPSFGSKTEVVIPLKKEAEDETSNQWSAAVVRQGEKNIYVSIYPPSTCLVGEWKLQVDTKLHSEVTGTTFQYRKTIIILFNPWCKSDSVYLSCEEQRKEYVLNENGILFKGTRKFISPEPWYFGHFQKDILKCALLLFSEISPVEEAYRYDPVRITRSLTSALNCKNNIGVLLVKHGVDCSDGTEPNGWAGSVKILSKYYKSKQPIKYGDSWVLAGICTTVCRALGIPCRPVTVYNCAHDNDGSLLVDIYLDCNFHEMKIADAVWEYHIWNEVWMKRSDLSREYDGWNVIDAMQVKQCSTTNVYQCGPASLKAIKNGEILKVYDTRHLYASLNAALQYWKFMGEDKPMKLLKIDTISVGCKIVTKSYKNNDPVDMTEDYKSKEGNRTAHGTMESALISCRDRISRVYTNKQFKKITIKLEVSDECPMIGSGFIVTVTIKNIDERNSHKVNATIAMELVSNTHSEMDPLKDERFVTHIQPQQEYQHSMKVTYDDYKYCNLKEEEYLRIGCSFFVNHVDFDIMEYVVIQLRKPILNIMIRRLTGPMRKSTTHRQENNLTTNTEGPLQEEVRPPDSKSWTWNNNMQEQQQIQPPIEQGQEQIQIKPPIEQGQEQIQIKPPIEQGQEQIQIKPPVEQGQEQIQIEPPIELGQEQQQIQPPIEQRQEQIQIQTPQQRQQNQQGQLPEVPAGLVFEVVATLTNPLPVKLTNSCFRFEGAENLAKTKYDGNAPPNSTVQGTCQWKLMCPGKYSVTGTFTSNELEDVHGTCEFVVT